MLENRFINELLLKIGANRNIIKVPVLIDSQATIDNCFPNVLEKIKRDGGSIIYGWTIHTFPYIYEAEKHAVWKSENNELIDITPKKIPYNQILFVPDNDNTWNYTGEYIDNIRINITTNSVVDDYIILNETISKLFQIGKRNLNGELMVTKQINNAIEILQRWKTEHEKFMYSNGTIDSLCYCCKNKPYKLCIGLKLRGEMQFILDNIRQKA